MKLHEVTRITTTQAGSIIHKLGVMLNIEWPLHYGDVDWDEVCADAVKLLKLSQSSISEANTAISALADLSMEISSDTVGNARGNAEAVLQLIEPVEWFKDGCNTVIELAQKAPAMRAHAKTVLDMYHILHEVLVMTKHDQKSDWMQHYTVLRATFRKLGLM